MKNQCSNNDFNSGISGCPDVMPRLLYTSKEKIELPKERFKITNGNKEAIKNFKCFSSPNGLIIEVSKDELFPPYKVEMVKNKL